MLAPLLAGVLLAAPTLAFADTPPGPPTLSDIPTPDTITAGPAPPSQDSTTAGSAVDLIATDPAAAAINDSAPSTSPCRVCTVPTPSPTPPPAPAPTPFLFSYIFEGGISVGGGYFTVGGNVDVHVRYANGAEQADHLTTAQPHPVTPGGAIYTPLELIADCAGGPPGYVQAYDETNASWSNRVPITICPPPGGGLSPSVGRH